MTTINQQLNNAVQNLGNGENSQTERPGSTEKAQALMTRYGSLMRFEETFCPQAMTAVAKDPGRAYCGTAPTLEEVRLAFGGNADVTWLCTLLDYFIEYCGKGCMSGTQIMGVAQRLSMKSYMKVTEFMLFFWRLGNADYGRIYGTIDPLYIMDGFNKFLKQRENELGDYSVTSTDEVTTSSDWPVIKPSEFYQIAKNGGCIDSEAAEIALQVLNDYDGEYNG